MSKIQIKNRRTGNVLFECELSAEMESASLGVKLGFATRAAHLSSADLPGANLRYAILRDADLSGTNLRDADLRDADLRGADLPGANLRYAVLRGANLSGTNLRGADLRDADLRGADLRGADLPGANLRYAVLRGANLSGTNLRGADLRDADLSGTILRGAVLSDAPKIKDIHQAVYTAASAEGALDMSTWHSGCGTAHCRAGWVTHLAGETGAALERDFGTAAAAALIYLASDPALERVPNWYVSNKEALADMKRLAEEEASRNAGPATA